MVAKTKPRFTIEIEAPANGRVRKAEIKVLNEAGAVIAPPDRADMSDPKERKALAKRLAPIFGKDEVETLKVIETEWLRLVNERRRFREQAEAGSAESVPVETLTLLDTSPPAIRRPLCLVNGYSYAAAWLQLQRTRRRSVDSASGAVTNHDPPLVVVEDVLVIVDGSGNLYTDAGLPNARSLAELRMLVRLPSSLPPDKGWSGAGVKRFLAGARPEPAEVFRRLMSAVNRFVDFSRSLSLKGHEPQAVMCELTACYILATYLLDAFHVIGYLWPNGEKGCGKTQYEQLIVEVAYLGQLILAGGSYACLRDLADYGATLAFDDAENVMDVRRTDPDKRTLLLAGNRRGATVPVKELEPDGKRWVTRHVNTFCPRLFSAIRLPDDVLGSRSILVPLVRSGDPVRAKSNPANPQDWPCDRRQLVDDLWALGLQYLPELPAHEQAAATQSTLAGRDLDPWRAILAVARWLQECHDVDGLHDRMQALARSYHDDERSDYEDADRVRVLFRVLLNMSNQSTENPVKIVPGDVAKAMCTIATDENLHDRDEPFITAHKVGGLLKKQRFRRPAARNNRSKGWQATKEEIRQAASAYGICDAEDGETNPGGEPADAASEASQDDPVPF